ncbi:Uncharacterized protein DAT39_017032 [Clarias magur]|uniref:Uncharacterized protein n=1 Tax=Clarias magur TaxID=1594786 RepID=A0A8J4TAZ7_CLAMG|nr:Uncharacterized protein DAT39_017032 [Clarias magur]
MSECLLPASTGAARLWMCIGPRGRSGQLQSSKSALLQDEIVLIMLIMRGKNVISEITKAILSGKEIRRNDLSLRHRGSSITMT